MEASDPCTLRIRPDDEWPAFVQESEIGMFSFAYPDDSPYAFRLLAGGNASEFHN
jgi:hypothetical protein